MIPIYENYESYRSPRYVYRTIAKLLSELPKQYLTGLRSVVLTNASAIGKGKTGRIGGKKYARRQCMGFYHPERNGEQAWIEIIVDNLVANRFGPGMPRLVPYIPPARNMAFADMLYHEVGHHLNRTIRAPAPGDESGAEAWKTRLLRAYFRRRYWYLKPFLGLAKAVVARLGHLDETGPPRPR
jgi:hypothetical protein